MGVVAVASVRSAGVSTTVAALAAVWPTGRRLLLVEADPAGGSLAARWGLPAEPGLVSLAAAARRQGDAQLVGAHAQPAPYGGAAVVAGPVGAEQARAALAMAGPLLTGLGELDADVLVDCGRLDPAVPVAAGLFTGADVAVLVARPQLPDLHAVADWLERHRRLQPGLGLVLVGPAAFAADDIAATLDVEVLGCLPHDPAGVGALGAAPSRGWRRSRLVRCAQRLAEVLTARLPTPSEQPPAAGTATADRDHHDHDHDQEQEQEQEQVRGQVRPSHQPAADAEPKTAGEQAPVEAASAETVNSVVFR